MTFSKSNILEILSRNAPLHIFFQCQRVHTTGTMKCVCNSSNVSTLPKGYPPFEHYQTHTWQRSTTVIHCLMFPNFLLHVFLGDRPNLMQLVGFPPMALFPSHLPQSNLIQRCLKSYKVKNHFYEPASSNPTTVPLVNLSLFIILLFLQSGLHEEDRQLEIMLAFSVQYNHLLFLIVQSTIPEYWYRLG